jgi:ferritin-like metal-binding protein YciE
VTRIGGSFDLVSADVRVNDGTAFARILASRASRADRPAHVRRRIFLADILSKAQPPRGLAPMKIESLRELLVEQLHDLYDAEQRLTKALPKMAKAASSPQLKGAFKKHLTETEGHVTRLEQAFKSLDEKVSKKTCKAMQGLIAEGEDTIEEDAEPEVKDAALIAAAQRVEHYEIAAYGTVSAYAKLLERKDVLKLLQATLAEEKATDEALTELAESTINVEAA